MERKMKISQRLTSQLSVLLKTSPVDTHTDLLVFSKKYFSEEQKEKIYIPQCSRVSRLFC